MTIDFLQSGHVFTSQAPDVESSTFYTSLNTSKILCLNGNDIYKASSESSVFFEFLLDEFTRPRIIERNWARLGQIISGKEKVYLLLLKLSKTESLDLSGYFYVSNVDLAEISGLHLKHAEKIIRELITQNII